MLWHLIVTSNTTNEFILGELSKRRNTQLWIGGTDKGQQGYWMWTDQIRWDYEYWAKNQPSNTKHDDCLRYSRTLVHTSESELKWNDWRCGHKHRASRQKKRIFYSQANRKSWPTPPLMVIVSWFSVVKSVKSVKIGPTISQTAYGQPRGGSPPSQSAWPKKLCIFLTTSPKYVCSRKLCTGEKIWMIHVHINKKYFIL